MIAAEGTTKIPLPREAIAEICRRHGVGRLEVFGSVLRDDFRPDSDVDFLVVFRDGVPGLMEFQDLQDELARLLGRDVDLIQRKAVERSPNYLMRRSILSTARPIYDGG